MKKIHSIILLVLFFAFVFGSKTNAAAEERATWWQFQSIDTMKYSRDLSREKLNDLTFDEVIEKQTRDIAEAGATHIAIATPYDDEFLPILKRWVKAAKKNNLNVWFRGNFSGWESWFGYGKITREEHIKKTEEFIKKNKNIFRDGDIFTACPECENGGPGDPRMTGDIEGHRKFLIDEYTLTKNLFRQIGHDVLTNFNSMNGDVARLIMDRETTAALGGVVTVDHYVSTPEKLISDVKQFAQASGGKVVLGEFGAPIPDINGQMSEEEQAEWISAALEGLVNEPAVAGVNYWANIGSSTALWNNDGSPRQALASVRSVFSAPVAKGYVKNEAGGSVEGAYLTYNGRSFIVNRSGAYTVPLITGEKNAEISAPEYSEITLELHEDGGTTFLKREREDLLFKIMKFLYSLFNRV